MMIFRFSFLRLSFIILSCCLLPAVSNALPETVPGVRLIKLNETELSKLGITIKNGRIEYLEKKKYKDNIGQETTQTRRVVVTRNGVGARNYTFNEKDSISNAYPRLVVNTFADGSAVYYSSEREFSEARKGSDPNDLGSTKANAYAGANSLYGVYFECELKPVNKKTNAKNIVYFWFEPSVEFLAALPPQYSDSILNVMGTGADSTQATFTENQRNAGVLNAGAVFPNPVAGDNANLPIYLDEPRTLDIGLYDVSGKKVRDLVTGMYMQSGDNMFGLKLNDLMQGMYLVVIISDRGERAVQRVIIVK